MRKFKTGLSFWGKVESSQDRDDKKNIESILSPQGLTKD